MNCNRQPRSPFPRTRLFEYIIYNPAGVYFFTHALTTYRRLHDMYSATFKRRPSEGVDHDLTNHTSLSSRFIAYLGSIRGEIRPGCRSRPQTMCTGFPHHQTGDRYTVPRTYRVTAHPEGQRYARPPVNYKHQKLVATPGQRTWAVNKSSRVIFQGPTCGSSCSWINQHRTQFLRTVSMRQPTMYSYMASHRYLYQIVFTHLALNSRTCSHISNSSPMNQTRHNSKHIRH